MEEVHLPIHILTIASSYGILGGESNLAHMIALPVPAIGDPNEENMSDDGQVRPVFINFTVKCQLTIQGVVAQRLVMDGNGLKGDLNLSSTIHELPQPHHWTKHLTTPSIMIIGMPRNLYLEEEWSINTEALHFESSRRYLTRRWSCIAIKNPVDAGS